LFGQVENFLQLIEENPQYPSLRTKNIQGADGIFEASLNMAIRVTFEYVKPDTIYLRNVGEHDITLKRK
jgi:mRNA interferase RelE/StbE